MAYSNCKRLLVAGAPLLVVSACATNGANRFNQPASMADSFAPSTGAAVDRLTDICLLVVFEEQSLEAAVQAQGLEASTNPFNERQIIFPETSYSDPATPSLHVFHSDFQARRMCTLFALDGDPQAILDGWELALRDARIQPPRRWVGAVVVINDGAILMPRLMHNRCALSPMTGLATGSCLHPPAYY